MTDTTAVYAEITKHERDANGDLVVFGRATGPDLDLDRQICDPDWLKTAMPEWFRSGANVREQHSSIAAGVGTEIAEKADGGWDLRSLVVDANSARKVEKGVLKGYSIGIRSPQVVKDAAAPGGRIIGGQIVEVSLVDRPANPTCQLTLAKALKPGPVTVTPGTVDVERHLVKVEELHEQANPAAEVLDALKALDVEQIDKAGQSADIKNANRAIAIIAKLIQSEAEQLAANPSYEACDIELLLDAVRALDYFKCRENKEGPTMAHVEMAETPDTEKAAAPDAAPTPVEKSTDPETPAPPVETPAESDEKSTTPDLTELVKALQAQVTELNSQVTKAMSAPAPGGPVLTRTVEDTTKAASRELHLAKAAEYDRLAYEIADPQARAGYLQLAATERAAATS